MLSKCELYLENRKGEEIAFVSYEKGTGHILSIEVYSEFIDDWVEVAMALPLSRAAKLLLDLCQERVEERIHESEKEILDSKWHYEKIRGVI